jgi:molybdopterin-guanine dinucleotide biosynthesis protein A
MRKGKSSAKRRRHLDKRISIKGVIMACNNTAIILAGGKSSRMGFDKQFLKLQDKFIVEITAEKLEKIFNEIIIVTNKPKWYEYGYKLTSDEIEGFGPLAGIHAGLKSSSSMYNYVVACDMPFINTNYIRYMMELIECHEGKADAVITRYGDWIEPFNAFYSRSLLPRIEESFRTNNRQINKLLKDANVYYISEAKAREFSPDWEMFTNVNTFTDYQHIMDKLCRG